MPASRDDAKTVVINGLRYPLGAVVERSQLGIFDRKFIVGDAQYDSDSYQSAVIYSDLSGGIGIEDSDEGADTTRFWFGVMDTRSPRMIGLPPLVTTPTPPTTGACRPLGVIGTQFYACFGIHAYGWKDSTEAFHVTDNNLDFVPVNKPVSFDGRTWIPQGTNGIRSVTETTAASGSLTEANITATPEAAGLAIWNNVLYAIATDGDLWKLVQGSTTWAAVSNSAGTQLKLNTSETPKNLITYFNRAGEPTLWVVTDRAAYQFYEQAVEWRPSNILFPPHPDFGRAATVWRTGEDLWIAAGLDIVRQTTGNAIVPLASGVARDQGVPQEYRGTTLDLCPEISHLYALVGPGTAVSAYDFHDTIGAAGTGNGQFDDVRGLSVDSSGNVFACDENNERIQKFDTTLTYSSQFGASGTGNGQFSANNGPYDCAHDSTNNLFVVDRGNSRIQKFNSAGTYQSQFGTFDDGTDAVTGSDTWTLQNTYGPTFNGLALSNPRQVAIDSTSRVLIADTGNARLVILTSGGAYSTGITGLTSIWGVCVDSSDNIYVSFGTSLRKYNSALTVQWTVTPGGSLVHLTTDGTHVWACDFSGNKVWKRLCSTGAAVSSFGSLGSANGRFGTDSPYAIAVDATYLYVTDRGNDRIQKFNKSTNAYVDKWTVGLQPAGVALDSSGNVVVADAISDTVTRYTTSGTLVDSFAQTDGEGVGVATGDVLWVSNITAGTIAKWDEIVVVAVAVAPPANGSFNLPESLDIKSVSGRIYVADTANHRIQYFTSAGAYEGQFGSSAYSAVTGAITAGTGNGELDSPSGVAVNQTTGDVYVLDTGNDRVQQFTATGTYIRQWGSTGTGNGQFGAPTAIGISPATGNVFVTDSTRDDVQEFSAAGAFIRLFGSSGSTDGKFAFPAGIAFNAAGTSIYVSDLTNEDVQEFVESTSSTLPAAPTLHAWPGTGWHCLWAGSSSTIVPTWMTVSAPTTHYRLWWGDTDGVAYYLNLFRGFENPNQARLAGTASFAATGYFLTSKFDAGLLGFRKAASHVTLIPIQDSITSTETITVEYAIDDGGWESLGVVNATTLANGNSVSLSFGATGRAFQTIRFKVTGARGSTVSLSPFLRSLTLFFRKIPQAARSLIFTISPNASEIGQYGHRTGQDMFNELDDLADTDDFFSVTYNGLTFEHCAFAGATGRDNLVDSTGERTVSIIELPVPA